MHVSCRPRTDILSYSAWANCPHPVHEKFFTCVICELCVTIWSVLCCAEQARLSITSSILLIDQLKSTCFCNLNLSCPRDKRSMEGGWTFTARAIREWNLLNVDLKWSSYYYLLDFIQRTTSLSVSLLSRVTLLKVAEHSFQVPIPNSP